MTAAECAAAARLLRRRDPVLGALVRRYGPCGFGERTPGSDPFGALVRAIVSQQLSTKAADTILSRLLALFAGGVPGAVPAGRRRRSPVPSPAGIAALPDAALRGAGLSGMKVAFLRDLSARVLDGSLDLSSMRALPDEDVVAALVQVKGIGRWTADMFLMFQLRRPDVMPVGDLGIARAIQRAYGLRAKPTPERMTRLAEPWRPYRSVACWYLWASLDGESQPG